MKQSKGMISAGSQAIQALLGGQRMKIFLFLTIGVYVITLLSYAVAGSQENLILTLITTLAQGFVAAECIMLYQHKESRNFRHLSVFCILAAMAMFVVFLGLLTVMISLIQGYSAGDEEFLKFWAEEDIGRDLPSMILTVVQTLVNAVMLLILRFSMRQAGDLLDHKNTGRNWFRASAYLMFLYVAVTLAIAVMEMGSWMAIGVQALTAARDVLLGVLLLQAGREYAASAAGF